MNRPMAAPRVLILRAPGTNCDHDTAFAFEKAGAVAERVHVNQVLESPDQIGQFQILCVPGGFSYGDDIAAGRILGNQIRHHLGAVMSDFKARGNLILGICNGFQVLIKSGVLLPDDAQGEPATLTWNVSGRYQDRWAELVVEPGPCVFLRGLSELYLPIAHAEGKFVPRDDQVLAQLQAAGQLALKYRGESPNGSIANVAGVCDETGRVFGLMPHPERHIDLTHHPRWTRGEGRDPGDGFAIFQNAVNYFR